MCCPHRREPQQSDSGALASHPSTQAGPRRGLAQLRPWGGAILLQLPSVHVLETGIGVQQGIWPDFCSASSDFHITRPPLVS